MKDPNKRPDQTEVDSLKSFIVSLGATQAAADDVIRTTRTRQQNANALKAWIKSK